MSGQFVPANGLQNGLFSYQNIERRSIDCRRKKRNTYNALCWEINAGENIAKLEQELKEKTYHPSRSILFAARKPKLREIFAAHFRDRVVHHILIGALEKIWEPIFIYDSYACRDTKGTHKAVTRLQSFLRKISKNGYSRAYYLQLDIKDFFININKEILFTIIKRKVHDPDVLWLTENVLFWDCTKSYIKRGDKSLLLNIPANKSIFGKDNLRGLPIGNLTSQFFANIYLDQLDQFIKHTLKAHYYLRYVDDFVLLSKNAAELSDWQARIEEFLAKQLILRLHPRRRKLLPISNGIDFLGYVIRPQYILVRRRVVNNLKEKLRQFRQSKVKDLDKIHDSIASYLGHFKHANAYRLTKKLTTEVL